MNSTVVYDDVGKGQGKGFNEITQKKFVSINMLIGINFVQISPSPHRCGLEITPNCFKSLQLSIINFIKKVLIFRISKV